MKSLFADIAAIAFGLFLTLLLLEGALRLLPVNEGLHTQPVNADSPVYHFEPNRDSVWSRGPDFALVNRVHTNNCGFVNDLDYLPDAPTPLAAVIGDSYVEAVMVPSKETLQARLASDLQGRGRVYSFAASGAPLSQYLAYARYACSTFHADKLIFVVVGNDFDESLFRYAQMPGFHYFSERNGKLELVRRDYEPSWTTRLARHSRLALYLLTNARVQDVPARVLGLFGSGRDERYVGQTSARIDAERLRLSRMAVDEFLRLLPQETGLPAGRMLFVVDGVRPRLYDPAYAPQTDDSYFAQMRREFMVKARRLGFGVIDMQPLFRAEHALTGGRFEFAQDAHWNGAGHELAARAVRQSGFLDDLR
ncbi:hypothetical protein [Paucidesulfovibrio longus]|uniref:hypothetical protein n=1 Tax=Paucidesulfovibrio longus TaxID=889 RepID=UPI0003B311A3|nr:hypothetical protein [Paucidesulfovibrio longus]